MKVKPSALAVFAKSKVKAKAEARRLSQEELEKLIASLNEALKAEKEKTKKKQEQDRVATIRKVNDLLAESGLKPEDLKKNGRVAVARRRCFKPTLMPETHGKAALSKADTQRLAPRACWNYSTATSTSSQ